VAAFGREATRRGVPPPTVSLFGSQFVAWRGIPLIPSDKIAIEGEKTKIGIEATVRASLALYNTYADIDALATALQRLRAGAPPRL
jgi:hypothetical protein